MAIIINLHKCLQTTEIYSLTTVEARSPKSVSLAEIKVLAGLVLSGGSRGESILASFSFWWQLAFCGLWPNHSNFQGQYIQISLYSIFIFTFSPLCVCEISLCLPLIRTPVMALRTHLDYPRSSPFSAPFTKSHLQSLFFQIS